MFSIQSRNDTFILKRSITVGIFIVLQTTGIINNRGRIYFISRATYINS